MTTVWVLNGPNLNRLGLRDPAHYGTKTLAEIEAELSARARGLGVSLRCEQSNHEGQLIDWIQQAADTGAAGLVINAGALTHTSYALRDALADAPFPKVEVHLSNVAAREPFRQASVLSAVVDGVVAGFGPASYWLGLSALVALIRERA